MVEVERRIVHIQERLPAPRRWLCGAFVVDHARGKNAAKRGGGQRVDYDVERIAHREQAAEVEALDEALNRLAREQPQVAELVQLRYFVGLSIADVAEILGISPRSADAWWAYARGWLAEDLEKS